MPYTNSNLLSSVNSFDLLTAHEEEKMTNSTVEDRDDW